MLLLLEQALGKPAFSFESEWPIIRGPLILFLSATGFYFLQGLGGGLVFSKWLPGSIQPYESRQNAIQLLFYSLLFFINLRFFSSREKARLFFALLALEVIFLVCLGFYQERSGQSPFVSIYGFYGVWNYMNFYSSFVNSNHYGGFTALAFPFFLGCIAYAWRKGFFIHRADSKFLELAFYGAVLAAALVSTVSARARAAFAVETLLCLLFFMGFFLVTFQARSLCLASMTLALLSYWGLTRADILSVGEKLIRAFIGRFLIWKESLAIFSDYPLFGTGFGTYQWISKVYQKTDAENFRWVHAHNDALELLTDSGILGLGLFAAALILLAGSALKKSMASPSPWCRVFGVSSFAGVAAFGALSLTEFYSRTPAITVLFLAHLALLVKCGTLYEQAADPRPPAGKVPAVFFLMSLMGLLGWLGLEAVRDYSCQRIFDKAERYKVSYGVDRKQTKREDTDLEALQKAVRLRPGSPKGWALLGDAYFEEALEHSEAGDGRSLRKSIEAYQSAARLAPTWAEARFNLGKVKIEAGRQDEGFEELEKAVRLSRYNRDGYLYVLVHLLRQRDLSRVKKRKLGYRRRAASLLEEAARLGIPFTRDNYNYIGLGAGRLHGADDRRVIDFIDNPGT